MATFLTLDELAATIGDGMSLAIPNDQAGVAMAATLALTARASKNLPKNLHVICVPISGMQADILIGRGMVSAIETSAVTLGEAGGAPRFADGIRHRAFRMMDATCPALLAGFVAGQKGVPFMAIRGLIGSAPGIDTRFSRHAPNYCTTDRGSLFSGYRQSPAGTIPHPNQAGLFPHSLRVAAAPIPGPRRHLVCLSRFRCAGRISDLRLSAYGNAQKAGCGGAKRKVGTGYSGKRRIEEF